MTDSTALPPQMILVSTPNRIEEGPTAAADDGAMLRLAIWVAEVSAEAAHDGAEPSAGAAPAALAARRGAEGVPPAPGVVR